MEKGLHEGMAQIGSDEMKGKFLTFLIDKQLYGMPIAEVVQIIGIREITPIPAYPYYAKGIIQLRDGVIPVIDIRLRFDKEERPYDEKTCIIVSAIGNRTFGFIVDEVDAVSSIGDDMISDPPNIAARSAENAYLTGIARQEGKNVLILDCAKIVPNGALDQLV